MFRLSGKCRLPSVAPVFILGFVCWLSAASVAAQIRTRKAPDPQTQLLNNYRNYADRYIRISGESWKYDDAAKTASHSFTLKNIAGVAYSEIELRVNYLSATGKTLKSYTLKIPGILPAYQTRKFKEMKVQKAPAESDQAVLAVAKAVIHP